MSIDLLRSVFQNLYSGANWSLQLLNIKSSKHNGVSYSSRQIILDEKELINIRNSISDAYLGKERKSISSYNDVREYDGSADNFTVYRINSKNNLISNEYTAFLNVIANPNNEENPFKYGSGYLIQGEILIEENKRNIKLISIHTPITTLKHKFLHEKGAFREFSGKVLSLRPLIDIVIVDDMIYFLNLNGEKLFNMERSYKLVCHEKVMEIETADIISGIEIFKSAAETGYNPRKFISFNKKRLDALKNNDIIVNISKRFSIPLDATGKKFDANKEGSTEKIVKLLCNRGMIDPFDESAMEVDSARKWK